MVTNCPDEMIIAASVLQALAMCLPCVPCQEPLVLWWLLYKSHLPSQPTPQREGPQGQGP